MNASGKIYGRSAVAAERDTRIAGRLHCDASRWRSIANRTRTRRPRLPPLRRELSDCQGACKGWHSLPSVKEILREEQKGGTWDREYLHLSIARTLASRSIWRRVISRAVSRALPQQKRASRDVVHAQQDACILVCRRILPAQGALKGEIHQLNARPSDRHRLSLPMCAAPISGGRRFWTCARDHRLRST